MKITDKGVMEPSFMDFSLPSDFANNSLYYIQQFGHFFCNNKYSITRAYLDSYLLFYIMKGKLSFTTGKTRFVAKAGQTVMLNCKIPHNYRCETNCEFIWFHFNGSSSADYYLYLSQKYGNSFLDYDTVTVSKDFFNILSLARKVVVNEHLISSNIHHILSCLATHEKEKVINALLQPALNYISENFDRDIKLDALTELCSMSLSQLIRSFRKYLNATPHKYILNYRLRHAQYLLTTSTLSVEEIADKCGFNSSSHFTRAFKKINAETPSDFRNMRY